MISTDESAISAHQHNRNKVVRSALIFVVVVALLVLFLGLSLDRIGIPLLSAVIFHLSLRPRKQELLATLIPAILFWISYALVHRIPLEVVPNTIFIADCISIGSLVLMSARAIWTNGEERSSLLAVLFPTLGLLVFFLIRQDLLNVAALQPGTFDINLFVVDGSLGFQPSYFVGNLAHTHAVFGSILEFSYGALPVAMAFVYAVHLQKLHSKYYMLQLFLAAAILGWLLYNLVPAAGPRFFLGPDFIKPSLAYGQLKSVAIEPYVMPDTVFRNAMPSLHMTWALLLAWSARRLALGIRIFAISFAVLTAIATLGTGEHYLVDLVVAFPFALFVYAICAPASLSSATKNFAVGSSAVLVFGWLLIVREVPKIFLAAKILPWLCMTFTVVVVQLLLWKLESSNTALTERSLP
jgi:hypothetical protein